MKIAHIAIYVNNLKQAKHFFEKYFEATANDGYHNVTTHFKSYFLTFDSGAKLEIMHRPQMINDQKSLYRTGYSHIAFSVGSKENVHRLTETLKQDGYHVLSDPRTTGDGYFESCIVDLEGNQIEITI